MEPELSLAEIELPNNDRNLPEGATAPKGISKDTIIACIRAGFSDTQIAKILGCSPANIYTRRQKWRREIAEDELCEKAQVNLLRTKRMYALKAITEKKCTDEKDVEKLTKAHKNLLHDESLLSGQPTAVIAYADLVEMRKQKLKELKQLEDQYGEGKDG